MTLAKLQEKLKTAKLDGYLVTRNNMFLGQDIRDDENLLKKLTGFTGSAGSLLILRNKAILFVDGRYELQAPLETDPLTVNVFCTKEQSFHSWLKENTANLSKFRLGINPWCLSSQEKKLLEINNITVSEAADFLPALLSPIPAKIFEHKIEFSGETREHKTERLMTHLTAHNADAAFFTLADSVSWLFNLRSDALSETPVLRAMALVDKSGKCWLFGDNLDSSDIKLDCPLLSLNEIPAILRHYKRHRIMFDVDSTPLALTKIAENNHIEIFHAADFCQTSKAIKNEIELNGIRQAHIRDGAAIVKFLCWLDKNHQGKTELDVVEKLHNIRSKEENYHSESFATIAASGPNGAIVHYHPAKQNNRLLDNNSLLLLDSGAQYYDGTTDITRTIALGKPSQQMIEDFTMVLKGHIQLSSAYFPNGTPGAALDSFARAPLWANTKDYNHGTGHGVGCFLNVHEGPLSLSRRNGGYGLRKGMITSIEPGYYKENAYGIRIENLAEITESAEGYLKFKNLTLVPIDKRLINKYLLSDGETDWLNAYHQQVEQALSPRLNTVERNWLQEACSPL